jgi:hypothetical protein
MAELRTPTHLESIGKNNIEPKFYESDLMKYKSRLKYDKENVLEYPLESNKNIATCEQILKTLNSNKSNVSFGINLRGGRENSKWNYSSLSPKINLFDKILPPITKGARNNVEKLHDLICRPKEKTYEVIKYKLENKC